MTITWNGHSCFTLQWEETTLVFDPYQPDSVPGLPPLSLQADLVYCTHMHKDHGAREQVHLSGERHSAHIELIPTFHDGEQGALRGENSIHILTAQGLRVAHLGDLGCALAPEQLAPLMHLDALLLPVGGYYTIDAQQAAQLVQAIKPRVVIPMHYRADTFGYEVISTVAPFLALSENVVHYAGNTLELTQDTPAQTALLTYPPRCV